MAAFELWCWRLLRVPWTARISYQSILKEINTEYSLEGLMLKLKFPIVWLPDVKNWLIRKEDPDAGKDWRQEEKGTTEDEMVGWHHWHNGHEFEPALGDGEGQGSLACCSPWGHKVGHNWVIEQQQQMIGWGTRENELKQWEEIVWVGYMNLILYMFCFGWWCQGYFCGSEWGTE